MHAWLAPGGIRQWDSDKGAKKYDGECRSGEDTNYHFRVYGPDGEGHLTDDVFKNFVVATSHIDHRENCSTGKWFGRSEEAEKYIAGMFESHGLWVEYDRLNLGNSWGDGVSNGYATVVHLDKSGPPVVQPPNQGLACAAPASWPTTRSYVNIFSTATGRAGPSNDCAAVGSSYTASNPQYVFCRRWGGEVRDSGGAYNHWWLWTDLDTGGQGWISAYYIQGQGNDQADDINTGAAIPTC
jgi:hypothetical protein